MRFLFLSILNVLKPDWNKTGTRVKLTSQNSVSFLQPETILYSGQKWRMLSRWTSRFMCGLPDQFSLIRATLGQPRQVTWHDYGQTTGAWVELLEFARELSFPLVGHTSDSGFSQIRLYDWKLPLFVVFQREEVMAWCEHVQTRRHHDVFPCPARAAGISSDDFSVSVFTQSNYTN